MAIKDIFSKLFAEKPEQIKARKFILENGASGTNISHGYLMEEYNRLFQGTRKYETFDEMYRSDDKCYLTMNVIETPILSTDFYIKSYLEKGEKEAEEKDKEIAEFIQKCLFERMNKPAWDQFIYEVCKMVRDGVSVFEIILQSDQRGITIDKLSVRLPKTIYKREIANGEFGITQSVPYQGGTKEVPGWKLLVFTFGREGDNYEGISLFRHAAKSWIAKRALEEYELAGFEAQFKGVRKIRVPAGLSQEEKEAYLQDIAEFQIGNDNTIVLPGPKEEVDFEFANMEIRQANEIRQAIKEKGAEIQDLMLATFLKLGSSEKGSYGMSKQGEEFFLGALEYLVKQICSVINTSLIPLLVDFNFGKQENYPTLSYGKIGNVDRDALSSTLERLQKSGYISPDRTTEQRVRDQLGLPEKDEEIDEKKTIEIPIEAHEHCQHSNPFSECVDHWKVVKLSEKVKAEKKTEPKKYSEFKSRRPLTFAEEGVNRKRYSEKLTSMEGDFAGEFKNLADKEKELIIKQAKEAIEANDFAKLATMEASSKELATLITNIRKQSFDFGKNSASEELGLKTIATTNSQKAYLTMEAQSMADKTIDDMTARAESIVAQNIQKASGKIENILAIEVMNEIRGALDKQIESALGYISTLSIEGTVNTGMASTRESYADQIYAFQFSAIIDGHTTDRCLSLDGRTVKAGSPEYFAYTPPQHYNCRSRWVAITNDTTYKPKIGGIPKSIPATADINNTTDLKRPVIQAGSPAIRLLQDEISERESKIKEYESNEQYPNRIADHQNRIDQLEKSLKGKI